MCSKLMQSNYTTMTITFSIIFHYYDSVIIFRLHQKKEIANHKNNMVATMMLSYTFVKSFSASGNHCVCVRNGKVYAWGENSLGRLGKLLNK